MLSPTLRRVRTAAAAAVLASPLAIAGTLGIALASVAPASTSVRQPYAAYEIAFFDDDTVPRSAGAIVGRLRLCVRPNGSVDGFYYPNEGSRDITIDGALDGDRITLRTDFSLAGLELTGNVGRAKISGAGTLANRQYTFVATPEHAPDVAPDAAVPACRS